MYQVQRSAILSYSAEKMFTLVSDVDSYPEFLPWCSHASVLSHNDNVVTAEVGISMVGVKQTFSTKNIHTINESIDMTLLNGPFSHLHGKWTFHALSEEASKIELDMQFDFSNRIIAAVVAPAFGKICENFIDAFKKRADVVYAKSKG